MHCGLKLCIHWFTKNFWGFFALWPTQPWFIILYMIDLKNILYGFEKHSLPWQKHILFQRLLFLIVLCKSSIYLQILLLIIAIKISHYDTGCFCLYLWNFAHIILLIFSSLLLHSEGGFFFIFILMDLRLYHHMTLTLKAPSHVIWYHIARTVWNL